MRTQLHNERGFTTFLALVMVGMLTLIGLAAMSTSDEEVAISGNQLQETRAFYAAESGLEIAASRLAFTFDSLNAPPSVLPGGIEVINETTISYSSKEDGVTKVDKVTTGSLAGLNAFVKGYEINAVGTNNITNASVGLSQKFETVMIPIFQWAIFFNDELWSQPAFDLSVDGRVHVNGDMYLQASKTMTFMDKVTCAGDIRHGLPSGVNNSGDVRFTDKMGNSVSMRQDGSWVDADHTEWYDTATTLWQGNVQDKSFGQEELNLPLSQKGDSHKMIERATNNPDSYQLKANFQIIDGVPMARVGSLWQDVSGLLPAGTIVSDGSDDFYDAHEKKTVRNTQIDMKKLQSSGYAPSNGIIYISDHRNVSSSLMNGATIINGEELGNPTTIACENPLYIQGDYNTINKQPASTLSDAVTFLSNNWDPAKSADTYTNRKATRTEVNLSILTGDIVPTSNNYGGGLENLPRYLEDWNSTEFKFRGSMVQMWRSQQAYGTWRYIWSRDAYYSAPTRNWGFDTDLEDMTKLPPGTPMVRVFLRKGWIQSDNSLAVLRIE